MSVENFDTRALALEAAILESSPGDQVFIHEEDCLHANSEDDECVCDPLIITVEGKQSYIRRFDIGPSKDETDDDNV